MRRTALLFAFVFAGNGLAQQRPLNAGAAEIRADLERARTVGSVLMIAAHPDDENTALLAYLAKGRHIRTGYLALTRGEGGQNLIGSEQSEYLGVIRTQELLAARRIDGAEQFFSRAIDFGFSKTADETMAKWGREKVLGDIVWVIRRFQPDVVVLRFSGTPRDGHGHHQTSAILGKEAFTAAADPMRFPEQLNSVKPWKAKRLLWNVANFGPPGGADTPAQASAIVNDLGEFDPLMGFSYSELSGVSRSQHRSQAMGSAERKGSVKNELTVIGGDPATKDLLEGVDTTWRRLPGGAAVAQALDEAAAAFDLLAPHKMLPALAKARTAAAAIREPWAEYKVQELDELMLKAAGVWLDASALRGTATPGSNVDVRFTAIRRAPVDVKMLSATVLNGLGFFGGALPLNDAAQSTSRVTIPANAPMTQPYWLKKAPDGPMYHIDDSQQLGLAEAGADFHADFQLEIAGVKVHVMRPVAYRFVDQVRGEVTRPLVVAPPVTVEFADRSLLFPEAKARKLELTVRANRAKAAGQIVLEAPAGWRVVPATLSYSLEREGDQALLSVDVTPPAGASKGALMAKDQVAARVMDYEHIPMQTVFRPSQVELVRADVKTFSKNIGYIMGAGDDVPAALRQWGVNVTVLSPEDISRGDLSKFDAIITGVRAYNVRDDLQANQQRLLDYANNGGTLVVQYNVAERQNPFGGGGAVGRLDRLGPYPFKIGNERVTNEDAKMTPKKVDHRLLQVPNRITDTDYEGWVQERGLYYATQWDERYETIWSENDPGEKPLDGGTLYTKYGKGAYVFTPLSWFRELPAGVPGAHRMFANIVSAGKNSVAK
jgi:LmbE family N-acetylglucosaminyl deacetylase